MANCYAAKWTLHCRKCNSFLASNDNLILGIVPPSQHHLAVRPGRERAVHDNVRKVERCEAENAKRAIMSKYKLLCQKCDGKVGDEELIEGGETLCFKAEAIFIKNSYGKEIKENKLKKLIPELKSCGIEEVNLAAIRQNSFPSFTREPPDPLVYCDVPQLSRDEINSLTLDNPREYQAELFRYAMRGNSLVFLPTGSGKTLIAAMAISCMKKLNPRKLAVFVVDRIPLAHQQGSYIKKQVPVLKVAILAGDSSSSVAQKTNMEQTMKGLVEKNVDALVLTHQLFLNFLADPNSVVCMSDVCILVIDEAHRCQGNHVFHQIIRDHYVKVSPDRYKPLVLSLTASPAGEATLDGTLKNLEGLLERLCCSARMPVTAQDLERYTNKPIACHQVIPLSPLQQRLQEGVETYIKIIGGLLVARHVPDSPIKNLSPSLPNYRGTLRQIICKCHNDENIEGHALAEMAMHFIGVLELNNVLGLKLALESLQECFEVIDNASTPVERKKKEIVSNDYNFILFKSKIESIKSFEEVDHGKFPHLVKELESFALQCRKDSSSRGIVFVNMRKTAHKFCERLRSHPTVFKVLNPKPFVGHGEGSDGMAWQGEQELTLKQFCSDHTKLLISTSVLEEGLDVPICNLVIRFDTSPSLRAYVQSRGRASRRPDSKFIVFYNDKQKQEEALLIEEKEKNMELAMRILHNTSYGSTPQAVKFVCEAKKPLLEPKKPPDQMPTQKSETRYSQIKVPCVNVVVHTPRATNEMPLIISFFNRNFEVKTMEQADNKLTCFPSEDNGDSSPTQPHAFRFELECENGQDSSSLLEEVTGSWCSRQVGPDLRHSQTWLECLDTAKRKTSVEVDILSAKSLFIGYFRHPTSFCQHWPDPLVTEIRCIRLLFQHDLKTLMIFFTVNENGQTVLYEIEIRYTELESFILVDKKEEYANLFLSLNHSPRLYKSEDGGTKWESILSEGENGYYSGEDSDVEEASGDEGYQVDFEVDYLSDGDKGDGHDDGDDDSAVHDETDDADEDRTYNENVIHTQAAEDEGPTFSHPLLKALNRITEWFRVSNVANSQETFGQCSSYMLRVSNTDLSEVFCGVKACGKDVFFARVDNESRPLMRATQVYLPPRLDEDIKYTVQCLFAYHPTVLGRITVQFGILLASKPKNNVLAALEKLGKILDENFFCQPEQALEKILQDPNLRSFRFTAQSVPSHCALVKRLIITPTRLLFGPEEIMQNNRVLRNYNPANFVCANIRDEDYSRISSSSSDLSVVLLHLKNILDGGVEVCGERYLFLGCSNSQLRNHSCWFVKSSSDPDAIRAWMGDFSKIRCVGTYVSRMGQCFSTSMDTLGISIDQGVKWSDKEDIVTEDEKYTFSDGVGGISQELAKEVVKKIGKKFKPSAFQIRFAGYKGVLAVDSQLTGKEAYFRRSMRKFESAHRRLEVILTSRPQAVFLNHQIIMLLSNLGVPEEVFLKLMREALDNLAGMLLDERRAVQQMSSAVKIGIDYRSMSAAGVPLTVEPFFRCVIAAVYYDRLQSLLTKARIKLPPDKARLMMGVMDETGTLQYGQVFVQYSAVSTEPNANDEFNLKEKLVLTGPVMVTRNPCLHPGDVRELLAVDTPRLRHLVDCVVFPRVGPRPHPSEMAGGDLDGDLYYVSWHKDLFLHPEKELFPPMDYAAPPKKEIPFNITPSNMTSFIIDYIRSDQLGVIDNAHKAHADRQPQGVESEKCLLLAEAHSLAVDAPKTGVWPDIKFLELRLDQYPDFMMKSDKPSYKSTKLLGKLYRACRAFKRNAEQSLPTDVQRPVVDRVFVVQGYKKHSEDARKLYSEYGENLDRLMTIYGIESEAELVSGCFRKLHKRLSRERTEVAEMVSRLVGDVRMKFRKRFFEEFNMDASRHKPERLKDINILQKASAWYHVAYAEVPNPPPGAKSKRFLSFPWIVDDVMTSIREQKKTGLACNFSVITMQQGPRKGLNQESDIMGQKVNDISKGLIKRLEDEKEMILIQYKRRLSGKNLVLKLIQNSSKTHPNMQVAVFGSSATLLFREDSDVDLCVYETTRRNTRSFNKKEQVKLLKSMRPVMGRMFKFTRLVDRAKVPVILCKKFKKTEAPSLSMDVPFDLSASRDGLHKAIVLSYYIMSDPPLLPILRFLLLWGHKSGLTGHGKRICVNTNALVFIFLSHCLSNGYMDELSGDVVKHFYEQNAVRKSLDHLQDWENILDQLSGSTSDGEYPPTLRGFSLGEVLIQFFASHATLERLQIPTSISRLVNAKCVQDLLKSCSISFLQEQMQRAYHSLAVHADLDILLTLCNTEVRETIHLSTGLSAAMKGAERENTREIEERTGAKISIRPKVSSSIYRLIVEARGTELQVEAVEHIIQDMTRTTSALRAAFMSMCFVKGASQMLFEGCRDDNDVVTLVPYHSYNHPQHDGTRLYTPMLATPLRFSAHLGFASKEFADFKQKFLAQFALARRDHEEQLHGTMEFAVRFGRIYIFRVPKSFIEDAEAVSIRMLQANLKRGYKAKPTGTEKPKRELVVTNTSVTRRNSRRPREKPKKPKEKKQEKKLKEKPCRSSYFTIIKSKERAERFLQEHLFVEVDYSETYNVNVKGNEELSVKFDGDLEFSELCFSSLRWCLSDVKRRWKMSSSHRGKGQDGDEVDVRFILQSRRSLNIEEIRDTEYETYQDLMQQPNTPVTSTKPKRQKLKFSFKEDLWNEVSMVRHKKTRHFRGAKNNTFLSSVRVELSEITEHSRPMSECSCFRKNFTRHELDLQLVTPHLSTSEGELSIFLGKIWSLAFEVSTFLS